MTHLWNNMSFYKGNSTEQETPPKNINTSAQYIEMRQNTVRVSQTNFDGPQI